MVCHGDGERNVALQGHTPAVHLQVLTSRQENH